jgi:hypothetical protein
VMQLVDDGKGLEGVGGHTGEPVGAVRCLVDDYIKLISRSRDVC